MKPKTDLKTKKSLSHPTEPVRKQPVPPEKKTRRKGDLTDAKVEDDMIMRR